MLSLRFKLTALVIFLMFVVSIGMYVLARHHFDTQLSNMLVSDLSERNKRVTDIFMQRRSALNKTADSLLESLAVLENMLASGSPENTAQISDVMHKYPHLDVLIITTPTGQAAVMNNTAQPVVLRLSQQTSILDTLQAGNAVQSLMFFPEHLFQIVGRPITNTNGRLGNLIIGTKLDAEQVEQIGDQAKVDLLFFKEMTPFLSSGFEAHQNSWDRLLNDLQRRLTPLMQTETAMEAPGIMRHDDVLFAYMLNLPEFSQNTLPPFAAVISMPPATTFTSTGEQVLMTVWIIVFLISGGIIALVIINRFVTLPLKKIHGGLEQLERENFQPLSRVGFHDEIEMLGETFNRIVRDAEEKSALHKAMEQIVSRDVARELMKGELHFQGERKQATVLYLHIKNFKKFADAFDAESLVNLLNNLYTRMRFCVTAHGGFVDKYLGNGMVAVFGVTASQPANMLSVIESAQDMLEALDLFNLENPTDDVSLQVSIGISAGEVITGNIGAEGHSTFSVTGEAVTTAMHLPEMSELYNAAILACQQSGQAFAVDFTASQRLFTCRELDVLQSNTESMIYEVLPRRRHTPELQSRLVRFQEAREHFNRGNYQKALDALRGLHEDWPEDTPTRLFLAHCEDAVNTLPGQARIKPTSEFYRSILKSQS